MRTQSNSEMQDQKNNLAALDTRVTNAITGGDIAAPFTYDVKNSSYSDTVTYSNGFNNFTVNQIKVGGCNANQPAPNIGTRTYSTVFSIKANYNLKANISVTTDYGSGTTGYVLIMVLDATSGATLYQRQVDLGSAINESISLSAFKGKNVRVVLKTVKAGSPQESFVVNCNINSLVITNQ